MLRDDEGRVRLVILPVSGTGFASTIYGYLALDGDLNTIRGITFYEHEETPGLGAEIENEQWRAKWIGKKVRDAEREWIPYVVVFGPREAESGDLAVRIREDGGRRQMKPAELAGVIRERTAGMPYGPLPLQRRLSARPIFCG